MLVGGFIEPSFVWNDVAPLLARSHRVYALDLDGFGYTERRGPWTLAEWGDQVQSFMRKLGINRPIVVGHSLGAAVAVELARRGLVKRIVLVDGDALGSGGAPWFVRDVLRHTPFVTSALRLATRWDFPVKQILANAYGPHHPHLDHSLVRFGRQFEADGAEHALETMAGRTLPGLPRSVADGPRAGDGRLGRRGRCRRPTRGPPDGPRLARAVRPHPECRAPLDALGPGRGRARDRSAALREKFRLHRQPVPFARPVAVELDAVVVGIAQVERLADAVVARALERNARVEHA